MTAERKDSGTTQRGSLQFDSMPIGCIVTDAALKILQFNPAFARIFRVAPDTDTSQLFDLIVPGEIRAGMISWLKGLAGTSEPVVGINENLRLDGTRITCRWTNVALRDDTGRFAGLMCMCEDVTAAQQAERQRDASEVRYRTLFEQASDGVLMLDGERRIVDANPEALRMLGCTREQLLRVSLDRVLVCAEPEPGAPTVGGLRRERWRLARPDGLDVVADVGIRAFAEGCHIASMRDQSALEAAHRRIEWQRNLFDLLSRCAGEVARLESREAMYAAVTRIAVEHGRFRFAWVGEVQPDGSVVKLARYGDDRGYVDAMEVSTLESLPSGRGPTGRAIRLNSTQVANDFRTDPVTAPWQALANMAGVGASAAIPLRVRGVPRGALMVYSEEPGLFNDEMIETLEKVGAELSLGLEALETEQELRESRQLLQTLIDGSPSPIFAFSADHRALLLNRSICELFGLDPKTAIGRRRHDAIPHAMADRHEADDDRVLATGEALLVEDHFETRRGHRIFLAAKYPLRDTSGRIFAVGGMSTDITELRSAQEALEQTNARLGELVRERTQELMAARDRAERADRTKTAFLSTISHELRSPLNAIMGFTDILCQGLSGPLNKDQAEQLAFVQESSRSMLALINELLDMSRIEAGRMNLQLDTFDLGALVERKAQALEPLGARKQLALEVHVAPDVGVMTSDAKRVGQIVTNLVSNAIKFTTQGHVTVGVARSGMTAVVTVEDTGPGIGPNDLERIFTPFEQAGGAQRHRDGTGLGLPIARQLARALGGDITVLSELGLGSRFTVTLPLESPMLATSTHLQPLIPGD